MKHRRQKLITLLGFAALLLLSLACGVPSSRPPRPFPIPGGPDDDYGSPLSHPERQFPVHGTSLNSVSFDPTGRWMATAGDDAVITIWNFSEARSVLQLPNATATLSVAFSPDGKTLASGGNDGSVKIWDAATGKLLRTLSGGTSEVRSVVFAPSGDLLASGGSDRTVNIWNATSGSLIRTLHGHLGAVNALAFSPDGETLASASDDKTLRLWDVSSGGLFQTLLGHTEPILGAQFSPDGSVVASVSASLAPFSHHGELKFWSAETGREIPSPSFHSATTALAFRPDGKALVLAYYGTDRLWNIQILDLRDGRSIRHYVAHSRRITQLTYSPDGAWLVSVGADKFIRAWH